MAVVSRNPATSSSSGDDPLLPHLWSIRKALDGQGEDLEELVFNCVRMFKDDERYQNDARFLKIWFLYMDSSPEFERVFTEMEQSKICAYNSFFYQNYALFLEAKGKLIDAFMVYQLGISRNAKPLESLKKAEALFRDRMSAIVDACNHDKMYDGDSEHGESCINPWAMSTVKDLLQRMDSQISKYEGYHSSNKAYSGKVALSSLQKSARNKVIDIGGKKYQIKGCAGLGGFAQVFKAYVNSNPDDVVALKVQKPPFSWEFYIYRQLDKRIPDKERASFGFAHRLHLYSDYSILVCNYLGHGTLQDAINSNVVIGVFMEEVLCIYYTIEMLSMLETLHSANILHGDFKPDNMLIRYARDDLTEEGFRERSGPWSNQGLCLVDWGRGIDLNLFPGKTKFNGDCRTSGFRCVEMQEKKPWTCQVDTYGLCVIVHMMLHNSYMEIQKKTFSDGTHLYQPKSSFKRYWQVQLWSDLFTKLLNINPNEDHKELLRNLRESFQDYMCSNPQFIRKLKQLLVKQRTSLCSA
ncbi:mitotic checkpoint serine/threonine-protein kinase BUB1 [Diospyros lotus]|uniref:mitotic checkpoint serine/threonine-protein kinase BUB1 n=1 Tax=Diospyros lotus TaxID=55363 RepID=UPI0022512A6F|nr:mitotic checkpoint serine/threonine-protein kinase BUB1 [Diospyros lotus]